MTWLVVAKKDFRDAVQSRALWALVGVFVVMAVGSVYAYLEVPELFGAPGGATFGGMVFFLVGISGLFVPLAAIVVCYRSIAGERELGSIKLLLSLPTTRSSVFVGKLLGRAGVLAFGMGVGVLAGIGFGAILLGEIDVAGAAVILFVTLLFAAVYATIVVGLSATTGSTTRATTLSLGFFVVFELLWDVVPMGVLYVVEGFSLPTTTPAWLAPLSLVSPSAAYFSGIVALVPDLAADAGADPAAGTDPVSAGEAASSIGAEPFYAAPEVGLVVLLLWLVVAATVGFLRFRDADL